MNALPDVVGPRRRGRVLVPRFNASAPRAMTKEWSLSLVSFGDANHWNPTFSDGHGTRWSLGYVLDSSIRRPGRFAGRAGLVS
jgi:hypothetical protein